MLTSAEILSMVNDFIDNLPYSRKPESLYDPIKYVLSLGGKRIRPVLMLLAYNLYKDDPESILMPACGIETYHNYTLLHDDLMDNADVRRGRPTVHRKWDANTAILSGDSMLVVAYQRIAACAPDKLRQVLDLFTETALEIGEGQQYDMDFETRSDVREEEYIEMIRLKTSVLLACAVKIGAILAGASDADADNLYKFGERMGLAFQLQDDLLDSYGDQRLGKAIGGDILEGKKTYLVVTAMSRADEATRKELRALLADAEMDPQKKIAAVKAVFDRLDVPHLAEQQIELRFERALAQLDTLSVDAARTAPLREFAAGLMGRTK